MIKISWNTTGTCFIEAPQTIGVFERSHAASKRILKLNTDEKWTTGYRYVDLATFIHNSSYHSSIGCTPSSFFHGHEQIKPIDLRFRSHGLAQKELTSDYLVNLQGSLLEQFSHTKLRLLDAYHKYRTYYDKSSCKTVDTTSILLIVEFIPIPTYTKWFCSEINYHLAFSVQSRENFNKI